MSRQESAASDGAAAPALADGWVVLLLVSIGVAAYANSFAGAFVFDDLRAIVDNGQIRRLWPPWLVLAYRTRPVLQLSLALNYALGGLSPWGYHALNLAVHIAAGLLLYAIVRRMFEGERLRPRYGASARGLAAAVAAIWLVHPLQTESVTYIIQRTESLMGMFYLLTLYCGIRACEPGPAWRWGVGAVAACALGMGSKEVMVSAPLVMLLYDRMFVAGSFAEALRRRWALYVSLAATWLVLGASLANVPEREHLMVNVTPLDYARTQFEVILHYLRLTLWPSPLIFDYLWPAAQSGSAVAPAAAMVLALVAGTVYALYRRWWVGFWGAWFFVILAPTSSVMPIADAAFEHRMYLSLAGPVVLAVVGLHELAVRAARRLDVAARPQAWLEVGLAVAVVAVFGWLTVERNNDYRSDVALWNDTLAKRPGHYRAHNNLGMISFHEGNIDDAVAHYTEALRFKPDYAEAHDNLGNVLLSQGQVAEATRHYREALRLEPNGAEAHNNLGAALAAQGNLAEAIAQHREALRLAPNNAEARNNLGIALFRQGNVDDAIDQYREALRLKPDDAIVYSNLGDAFASQGDVAEAIANFRQSLRLNPDNAVVHINIGKALASGGNFGEAIDHFREAARVDPRSAEAHNNLGAALAGQGMLSDAIAQYHEALRLKPDYPEAHYNLGLDLYGAGKVSEAIAEYREALRLKPDYAAARDTLRAAEAGR